MVFGSPELWIGETAVERLGSGGESGGGTDGAAYHAVVKNRGSKDAAGCRAAVTFRGIYDDLEEGFYRFSIEQSCPWVDGDDGGARTIPAGESRSVEVFRAVETGAEYAEVRFPTAGGADDDPPVDRYLQEGSDVQRYDRSDHVPLPVFVWTDWEEVEVHLTADNHGDVDRELVVTAPDGSVPAVDDVTFDVVFEDDGSVPSFKTP